MSRILPVLAVLGATALAPAAWAQPPAPAAAAPSTVSIQGDQSSWINDPHMHAFYDLTVQAFAAGPAKVDQPAFEQKSRDIFRAFAAARGMNPEAMVDHLKLIPGQVVQIAREDPEVLKSYANFVAAVFGPQ
jgi:hypothetical protein